jgi:hypothetical protein
MSQSDLKKCSNNEKHRDALGIVEVVVMLWCQVMVASSEDGGAGCSIRMGSELCRLKYWLDLSSKIMMTYVPCVEGLGFKESDSESQVRT